MHYNEDMKTPKIGAHISIAGGLLESVKRGEEMGVECMQIFPGSPRRYEVITPSSKEKEEFKALLSEKDIFPVYAHASYLLNLASKEEGIRKKSLVSAKESLRLACELNLAGVIYHPGSPKGGSKEEAILKEVESIKEILKDTPDSTYLILENTAGEKKIGTTPEEVGFILREIDSPRLKVCLDTAHSLESGSITDFSVKSINSWLSRWKEEVGLENILLFHINDSLTAAGSNHDRHENIGNGYIGREGFANLMSIREAKKLPWILEVPGFKGKGPDKENVDILKEIRD